MLTPNADRCRCQSLPFIQLPDQPGPVMQRPHDQDAACDSDRTLVRRSFVL